MRALIEVVRATIGDIVAFSDASYVVNGFNGGRHKHPTVSNFDLWVELGIVLSKHVGQVVVLEIKSHATVGQIILSGLSPHHFLGNALADTFAKRGTEIVSLPQGYLAHPDAVAKHVQHRIAVTLLIALKKNSGTSDPVPRTAASRKKQRFAELQDVVSDKSVQHNLAQIDGTVYCTECAFRASWSNLKRKLATCSQCNRIDIHTSSPNELSMVRQAQALSHLAHPSLDQSHSLAWFRGVAWCWKCGGWCVLTSTRSRVKVENLGRPCVGPRSQAGSNAKERLKKGCTPISRMKDWPEEQKGLEFPSFCE